MIGDGKVGMSSVVKFLEKYEMYRMKAGSHSFLLAADFLCTTSIYFVLLEYVLTTGNCIFSYFSQKMTICVS